MTVGVVIVTYNRIKLLKECVSRVLNQSRPVDAVIVVNNNSNDGTKEYLDSINDDRVIVSHESTNLGGAGGFHRALSIASAKKLGMVLIIDDDAMIERSYIGKILDFASKNPKYNAYAGAVYTEGKIDTYHRRRLGSKLIFWEKMIPEKMYDKPRRIDLATFCGLVIRGSELRRIGLPSSEYFIWSTNQIIARERLSKHLFIDATFHHPIEYQQLLIIIFKDILTYEYYPGFFILMSNKTEIL